MDGKTHYPQPESEIEAPDMVGPGGFEPPTSRLSGVRSNQLSYGPVVISDFYLNCERAEPRPWDIFPIKEVIHPHLPVGIPCYDFTPVTDHTVDACLPEGLARRLLVQPIPMV